MKSIWKYSLSFLVVLMVISFCGCSFVPTVLTGNNVETLKGWSFQYNKGTSDYSLFFGLLNKNDKYVSANVDVDIRIVNDEGEEVYKATKSVTPADFGNYTSQVAGEQFLAEIRISEKDVACGKSSNGTVYLTVYKDDVVRFDEVNCSALYCLPVSDIELIAENLPIEINVKGYNGNVESKIRIDEVSYSFEKEYTPVLKIIVSGTKIFGGSDSLSYDMVSYKLYDSQDCVIETGQLYIHSISNGDKFKDDSIIIYDITPGETYKIVFSEYSW
ncbi:MAG: hypothetical protein PUC29_04170 [Clostridia bacterium]|nr:hypothetical protein [Clostridia bacterium]